LETNPDHSIAQCRLGTSSRLAFIQIRCSFRRERRELSGAPTAGRRSGSTWRNGPEARRDLAIDALIENSVERRLLSPAESVNALTVGARSVDSSTPPGIPDRFDLFNEESLSPVSRVGMDFDEP